MDLKTEKKADARDGEKAVYSATVSVEFPEEGAASVTICGHGIDQTVQVSSEDHIAKAVFEDLSVLEWTAETPYLYDLYVETENECIKTRIGFKKITIDGRLFLWNGKKVKFHGVNHHDTSCTNGYTMTPEEIERDIRTCKEFNMDTVRTSHYPPDPYLLEMCDEMGIYVVDETDLEDARRVYPQAAAQLQPHQPRSGLGRSLCGPGKTSVPER